MLHKPIFSVEFDTFTAENTLGSSPSAWWSQNPQKSWIFFCVWKRKNERKKLLTQSNQVFACNIHRCQNSPECCNNTLSYLFLQRKFNQIRKCSKDLQFAAKVFLLNYLQISYHGIINQSSSFSSLIQFHKLLLFRRKSFNKFKKPVKCWIN